MDYFARLVMNCRTPQKGLTVESEGNWTSRRIFREGGKEDTHNGLRLHDSVAHVLLVHRDIRDSCRSARVQARRCLYAGKISTSWLIINLSAAIPAIGSILFYHEHVSPQRIAVVALAIVSVFLLWKDKQCDEAKQVAADAAEGKA